MQQTLITETEERAEMEAEESKEEGEEERRLLLTQFPDEIVLNILEFLDVPELYALTKTCHHLRTLSTDPLLHHTRLKSAKRTLATTLACRPTLPDLLAKNPHLYLTPREATQLTLHRSLARIRLKRHLRTRPSIPVLMERGVLPAIYKQTDDGVFYTPVVAPALVGKAKELERERIKDRLRGWVEGKRLSLEKAEKEGLVVVSEMGWPGVRDLVRKFGRSEGGIGQQRWGRGRVVRYDPPRARVLSLRTFYERLARSA